MTSLTTPTVHSTSVHSIQNDLREPRRQQSTTETTPLLLLRSRRVSCIRNFWAVLLITFMIVGFSTGIYLLLCEEEQTEKYTLVSVDDWKTKNGTSDVQKILKMPVEEILLTKTDTPECKSKIDCSREMNKIRKRHLKRLPDIDYNFVIGGDGQTYEGRGWNYQATLPDSTNNSTLTIAFLGKFDRSLPSVKQLSQLNHFLDDAERTGKLTACYTIRHARKFDERRFQSYLRRYFRRRLRYC